MGILNKGVWQEQGYGTEKTGGRFVRQSSSFRGRVTADGSSGFKAEAGRYHLYVSLACPWAHRTIIFRKLKRLEEAIGMTVVDYEMGEGGWRFSDRLGATPDPIMGASHLWQIYAAADPNYVGRVTVPVLWDRKTATIVNNESAEIIRMLNREFDAFGDASPDFCPPDLEEEIDRINALVYDRINNGVYKAGFASRQEAYERAFDALFDALDQMEERLSGHRYLLGDRLTEADWRLFTTLLRFDLVYVGHFKCNKRRIADYPALSAYLRDLYQVPGVADTVSPEHIKGHYYRSHPFINPTRIVPKGPELLLDGPHGRDRLSTHAPQ
jgi:putative glutathione S-transferase